ncbi:2-keto-3-deoxy-L-rhamnonate aldolase RhmA [Streptosporangium album]|uniref:2-keto-3-deoxy-L-rhamnonate aldolase RhmA n=1 Tax=Streptosporangium album TaxID=47479 RepID=A0A7W7WCK6_9ACTN|nr:aldolase/citrate lyase family protein [Streptosporangium album]MBB4942702.1 2-keto-3-deoxy-L-rhamnonate aldolase RhmA [Streptosporangium album]
MSAFLDRLREGLPTLMLGIRGSRTTEVVRMAHATGHHATLIDLEHSTMSTDVAAQLCSAADSLGMTPLVRVPEREYGMIGRLLDGGAHGIVAPRIETAEQAREVARACRFPPRGQRSQLAQVPQYGMRPLPARELNPALDDAAVVQILIETPAGIARVDDIARVGGVDMIAIGANDLTAELGVPGDYDDPRVLDAIATAARACRTHGKLLAVGGMPMTGLAGVCPLQITGMDSALLFKAIHSAAKEAL